MQRFQNSQDMEGTMKNCETRWKMKKVKNQVMKNNEGTNKKDEKRWRTKWGR